MPITSLFLTHSRRCASSTAKLHNPRHVFTNDIEFEVNRVADLHLVEVGMFEGIGDDGYGKPIGLRVHDRQADAIDRDGSLLYGNVALRPIEPEGVKPAALLIVDRYTLRGLVYMPLHDMAIQPVAHLRAAFEVNETPHLQGTQVALLKCFGNGRHGVLTGR